MDESESDDLIKRIDSLGKIKNLKWRFLLEEDFINLLNRNSRDISNVQLNQESLNSLYHTFEYRGVLFETNTDYRISEI